MGDVVNLRRVRKARARAAASEAAARNRASFGRGKAERTAAVDLVDRRDALLDAHRLSSVPEVFRDAASSPPSSPVLADD